jgi:chromate transporter
MSPPDELPEDVPKLKPAHVVPLFSLYKTFFWVGLFSFGGGLSAWVHREIVQLRGWMTDEEFFSGYGLSQVLPGVNSTNLSVYIGQHLRGTVGALVALIGLLTAPFVVVIAAAVTYQSLIGIPGFQVGMQGVAAAAIGMLIRMAMTAAKSSVRRVIPALVMVGTFAAVGIFKLPLLLVVLVVAPLSIAAAWPRKSSDA